MKPACIWAAGAEMGESPLWHAATRSVYFVDIRGRRIHRCAEDGSRRQTWSVPGHPGFIVPDDEGGFVCALEDGLYRFSEAGGVLTELHDVEAELAGNRFNDGYVDAEGRLWFGSMDAGETRPTGNLYRMDGDGVLAMADSGYVITNGPAASPDGRTLYHTDTLKKTVYAFNLHADGSLAGKRVFAEIRGSGHPDGMAVDAEGCVWIALFGGGRIERYSPGGVLLESVKFPVRNVTKLAFGGDDLCTVYATTAWKGLTSNQHKHELLAGGLFTFRASTPGLAQHHFSMRAFA